MIIENQLERTDHDHLGKIITYASGLKARIIIWIVKDSRSEHAEAVNWLNEETGENLSFFLIEVKVFKIGDSDPAPKFEIVEQPNGWAKATKSFLDQPATPWMREKLEFYKGLVEYLSKHEPRLSSFKLPRGTKDYMHIPTGINNTQFHIKHYKNLKHDANREPLHLDYPVTKVAFNVRASDDYLRLKNSALELEEVLGHRQGGTIVSWSDRYQWLDIYTGGEFDGSDPRDRFKWVYETQKNILQFFNEHVL